MPENYYCSDNFFQKMTDLESPRKNNDCYFYYYSTCTKGDNCTFRHEPSALGCETTCSFWKEGKCINVHCNFRHMELRKNRKTIPCYWESQPSGCKKPHCPFMHTSKKDGEGEDEVLNDEHEDVCNLKIKKDDYTTPVVDPIVVNFEEESDNECSAPTQSSHHKTANQIHNYHQPESHDHNEDPEEQRLHQDDFLKTSKDLEQNAKAVQVKTLEEIKLDRIQAESAAYYSYTDETEDNSNGRNRSIFKRLQPLEVLHNQDKVKEVNIENIQVLTLDEIRKRKRKMNIPEQSSSADIQDITEAKRSRDELETTSKTTSDKSQIRKLVISKRKPNKDIGIGEIKIKTLAEIKAERTLKRKQQEEEDDADSKLISIKKHKVELSKDQEEQIVSSTSKNDDTPSASHIAIEQIHKMQCIVAPLKRQMETEFVVPVENIVIKGTCLLPPAVLTTNDNETVIAVDTIQETKLATDSSICSSKEEDDTTKLDELLLDDDDDDIEEGISLKAEDDILNDIDNLLNE